MCVRVCEGVSVCLCEVMFSLWSAYVCVRACVSEGVCVVSVLVCYIWDKVPESNK